MVENGKHDGPATHAVTFVWNGHEVILAFYYFSQYLQFFHPTLWDATLNIP